jgi:DNA-binding NtrC family response regulator
MGEDRKKPISVLIVDDEQELLDFLAKRLRKRGFEVGTAAGGAAALERLGMEESPAEAPGTPRDDPKPTAQPVAQDATSVLLVDDEEELLVALGKRLRRRGFRVRAVDGGEAALAQLAEHPDIDVVILDVKLVGMSGLQVLRSIKADYPLVEVIVLTGHASVQNAVDAMRTGARDYLAKPCDIDVLVQKVEAAKSRKDTRTPRPK